MASGFSIRAATNADLPAIRELVAAVLSEHCLPVDRGHTDADLINLELSYWQSGGHFEVVVDDAGAILGSAGFAPLDAATVELRKMYLRSHVRGLGLGRELLTRAIHAARSRGYRSMTLETSTALVAANTLYRSAGFVLAPFNPSHGHTGADQAYKLDLYPVQP